MSLPKILFIDRDGTLCHEPEDYQVDRLEKIRLLDGVIPALHELTQAGYRLVMVSNQDGRGTESFPEADFIRCQNFILELFRSQGISFDEVLICPHFQEDGCDCRKPKLGLVLPYLRGTDWDRTRSLVIGDRDSDRLLAQGMGLPFLRVASAHFGEGLSWSAIADQLLRSDRQAEVRRQSKETQIQVAVNLDRTAPLSIETGLGFLDHMLEQIGKHAGISLVVGAKGDLHIDDHHTVEDLGLVLGEALRKALGDKRGIQRYGFSVPMDEAEAHVLVDLGGRPFSVFEASFQREKVGELATEMVPHFFRSLAETLGANIHIRAKGQNDHHIVEGIFKAFARALGQAKQRTEGYDLPSTKGLL
jgi:imidazoleglycerol-phosphate dehydratase/histidinol-phosphatase